MAALSVASAPFETLRAEAELVLVGTVTATTVEAAGPRAHRWTRVHVTVDEWVEDRSGTRPPTISIMLPGGSLDGLTTRAWGVPRLGVGDRALLLLERVGREWMPIGYRLGVYPLWGFSGLLNGYVHLKARSGEPARWETACLTYYLETSSSADLVREDVEPELAAAFGEWTAVANAYPTFGYGGATCGGPVGVETLHPRNIVLWRDTPGSWNHPVRVVGLTSTSIDDATGFIVDADMELNGEHQRFAVDGDPDAFDVRQIATHEAGHMLGLDHTPIEAAVMFEQTDKGAQDNYKLHPDDTAGLEASHPSELVPAEACVFSAPYPQWDPLCPEPEKGCAAAPRGAPLSVVVLLGLFAVVLSRRRT